ncbi:hypothetical protein [Bifidobacterium pullorum]|uniref:Uncharacterized protein n=1 Tax=Bifidobacterium pullorum subsp. gallinarum TaxID=78344 RepID=A0A921LWB7_9BIFI|nr:hypothetical protein [Bifidobacterium pullorum]HJG42200.1 hypothetical protein [Bifidobacterium pullorum subsp. gallinarum]
MRHTIRHGGCFLGVAGCGVLRDGDHGRAGADQLADQLVDIVEDERFVDRTMIMSMDQRAIGRVRERRTGSEWRVGYCVFWALGNLNWPIGGVMDARASGRLMDHSPGIWP